jgi:hypothetical protein
VREQIYDDYSTGFNYNGIINRRQNIAAPLIFRGSASYVTGQHNLKAGFDMLMTRRYVDYRERGGSRCRSAIVSTMASSPVLQVNSTYGPNWLRPTQILDARLFQVGVQVDF